MFTINIYLRFALIALLLIGGTLMAIFIGFWYSFPFLLAGVGLLKLQRVRDSTGNKDLRIKCPKFGDPAHHLTSGLPCSNLPSVGVPTKLLRDLIRVATDKVGDRPVAVLLKTLC